MRYLNLMLGFVSVASFAIPPGWTCQWAGHEAPFVLVSSAACNGSTSETALCHGPVRCTNPNNPNPWYFLATCDRPAAGCTGLTVDRCINSGVAGNTTSTMTEQHYRDRAKERRSELRPHAKEENSFATSKDHRSMPGRF